MNELAPLSPRPAEIIGRARNRPPLQVPLMPTSRPNPPAARLIPAAIPAAIAVLLHQLWGSDGVSAIATSITGDKS